MLQGPGPEQVDAISKLLLSVAALLGSVGWMVFKVMDRKDAKHSGSGTASLSNGSLERLNRAERDIVEAERRTNDQLERMREDTQSNFSDVNRRLERWEERWDEWLKNRGRG